MLKSVTVTVLDRYSDPTRVFTEPDDPEVYLEVKEHGGTRRSMAAFTPAQALEVAKALKKAAKRVEALNA